MLEKDSKWWNDGKVNKRSASCPGVDFIIGRIPYKRKPLSEETKSSISKSMKGNVPWNKGKKNIYSQDTIEKMSISAKERVSRGIIPDNTGRDPWNKGKTANEDTRIAAYSEKQKGQKRSGNYASPENWKGEKNPWYGKSRSGNLHPRYQEHRHSREYWDFYNKVAWATEKTYAEYKNQINPNDYPRTLCGVEGGYQLDHIISIDYGWKNNMTVEELACKENLCMLSWQDNRQKSNKVLNG